MKPREGRPYQKAGDGGPGPPIPRSSPFCLTERENTGQGLKGLISGWKMRDVASRGQ